jgi:hypothetical protein
MSTLDKQAAAQWESIADTWRTVSGEVSPPPGISERALEAAWPAKMRARPRFSLKLAASAGALALMGVLVFLIGPENRPAGQQMDERLVMQPMQPVPAHALRMHEPSTLCRDSQSCMPQEMLLQRAQPMAIDPTELGG